MIVINISVWMVFVVINILFAKLHDNYRRKQISDQTFVPLKHKAWAVVYCVLCAVPLLWSWKLCLSVILQHGCVFPVWYNGYSGRSMFQLTKGINADGKKGSWVDETLIKMGFKTAKVFNITCLVTSITLLILSCL